MTRRPLFFSAALADADPRPDAHRWTARARAAEQAGLAFVTVEAGPLDPLLVAARIAALTTRIGIVPAASPTVTEPFHVSTELATVDVISEGRAGWLAQVLSRDAAQGQVTWTVPADVLGDAAEHIEAVRALWDSWEHGAEIRDARRDRFIDRRRVHHVDFQGAHLAVRGPSITPRPPQGHPVVVLRATDRETLALAEAQADVLVSADADTRPTPGLVRVLEVSANGDLNGLAGHVQRQHARGWDGVLLHADDLPRALSALAPVLAAGAAWAPTGRATTLRERLGLAPAVNRFAPVTA